MTRDATVIVHCKDLEDAEPLQEAIEKRCQQLADEFHEADRFEVSVTQVGNDLVANAHARGKKTDVSAHAKADDGRKAADTALDRLERELRSRHDKRIFAPRREAKRTKAGRKTG